MSRHWGRLSCVCRRCRLLSSLARSPAHRSVTSFRRDSLLRCFRSPSPSLRPLRGSAIPFLRCFAALIGIIKIIIKIIRLSTSIIICKHHSKPQIERRSSGGTESRRNEVTERWRGGAGAAKREWLRSGGLVHVCGPRRNASDTSNLVLRCMLLKQTPVCRNSFQFADNTRILEITIRHPDFYNTEILLR